MNKHQTFDKEEQQIFKAFLQIEVNTDNLERSIINMNHKKKKRPLKLSFAMAALAVFLLISGTVYAATGGLEQFLERFNPDFGEFAVPPLEPAYTEDQGIRFEVYGAQVFDNVALIYYSLQDVSGENRLHERIMLDYIIFTDTAGRVRQSGSLTNQLHFDRRNNTLYYEARINIEGPVPFQLHIGTRYILYVPEHVPEEGASLQPFLTGNWVVEVNVDDTANKILIWEDTLAEVVHLERMVLSPLGLHVVGNYLDYNLSIYDGSGLPDISIECSRGGDILFSGLRVAIGVNDFDFFLYPESPIDVDYIAAVIMGGVRIPIP